MLFRQRLKAEHNCNWWSVFSSSLLQYVGVPSWIGKLLACICVVKAGWATWSRVFVCAKMLALSVRSAMWHDLCARRKCKCPACDQQTKQQTKPEDQQNWLYSSNHTPLCLRFFHPVLSVPFSCLSLHVLSFISCYHFFSFLVPFLAHSLILNTTSQRNMVIYPARHT